MFAALFMHGMATAEAEPTLSSDTSLANAGFYTLSWRVINADPHEFRLEESENAEFSPMRTLYQGADTAYAMSGKSNGDYYYRVAESTSSISTSAWSQPIKVTVMHHSLLRAISFFSAGAFIFTATLILIIAGARRTRTSKLI